MNKAFEAAKEKGRIARMQGKSRRDCPYEDKRGNYRNCNTFSRAFINAWRDGYDEQATNEKRSRHIAR